MDDEKEYLTTSEVARILSLSSERIRQVSTEGKLAYLATPYGRLYKPEDVEAYRLKREEAHSE